MMKYSIFTMLFISLFLWSCNQEELMVGQEETQEVYTVCLNFSGDIQTEESPLSRAETESRDLYGIQVYKDGEYFAAGMFDNTNDITINLLAGGSYKFVCTGVKEGKDKFYYSSSYGYGTGYNSSSSYNQAFSCDYGDVLWNRVNSFYYTTKRNYSLAYLSTSSTHASPNDTYAKKCAGVDRFYGELDNYTPSVNGIVNLELKRVSFGIKLKVTNLQEGTVSVTCKNDYNTFINKSGLTSDYESEGEVYSMANVYDAWQNAANDYTEPLTLTVTWSREGGLISDTWRKTIQVKRNVMNTIRIKMGTDEKEDTGIGVTPEGGESGEEEEEIPLG